MFKHNYNFVFIALYAGKASPINQISSIFRFYYKINTHYPYYLSETPLQTINTDLPFSCHYFWNYNVHRWSTYLLHYNTKQFIQFGESLVEIQDKLFRNNRIPTTYLKDFEEHK